VCVCMKESRERNGTATRDISFGALTGRGTPQQSPPPPPPPNRSYARE